MASKHMNLKRILHRIKEEVGYSGSGKRSGH